MTARVLTAITDGYERYRSDHRRLPALPRPPTDWRPTTNNRSSYLDLAEIIVREAATWLDANGAIIDPVEQDE